jgi:hypothetical protein
MNFFFTKISTNNIATGMVRGGHKYAFNLPKIRFHFISKKLRVLPPLSQKTVRSDTNLILS